MDGKRHQVFVVLAALGWALLACAVGVSATTATFSYTGAQQDFTVPAGVTQVRFSVLQKNFDSLKNDCPCC